MCVFVFSRVSNSNQFLITERKTLTKNNGGATQQMLCVCACGFWVDTSCASVSLPTCMYLGSIGGSRGEPACHASQCTCVKMTAELPHSCTGNQPLILNLTTLDHRRAPMGFNNDISLNRYFELPKQNCCGFISTGGSIKEN